MIHRRASRASQPAGQAIVETALVMPLFILVIAGIIVLGIGVFYQQQVANAAREAARYAAIHSSTSDCPTRAWKNNNTNPAINPQPVLTEADPNCDAPPSWPKMTAHGRKLTASLSSNNLLFSSCWSGYVDAEALAAGADAWDAGAYSATGSTNDWIPCTIGGTPQADFSSLPCPAATTAADDTASNLASSKGTAANQVTVYACYAWQPPFAGFLLVPQTITLRAVASENLQHQR